MWELLSFWPVLGPIGRALTLALTGLAIGSFLSVLRHRLPLRQDPWQGRSQCPACSHILGPAELVPVLSYLIQRGRCKHCQAPISSIYPLLELGTALLAAAGGLVSWTAGLIVLGALIAYPLISTRLRSTRATRGFTLVEVLVSLLLFALSIGAVFDLFGVVLHAKRIGYRRTEAVALARAQFSQLARGLRAWSGSAEAFCLSVSTPSENPKRGNQVLDFPEVAELQRYTVAISYDKAKSNGHQCQGLLITVECPDCPARERFAPITVGGYIRK